MTEAAGKLSGAAFSKALNDLVAQAFKDGVPFQHVVCQLVTTTHIAVGDFIMQDRMRGALVQDALARSAKDKQN